MFVLALDTATRVGSCAIVRGGTVLAEVTGDAAQPHGARLPGEVMALLDRVGVTLPEIDVYAVAAGPGSFTGLRVGIATMQGLAFAAGKPLVGVSAFDALAHAAAGGLQAAGGGGPARIATWIDAWRGEVYTALYEDLREVEPPAVGPPAAALERLVVAPLRDPRGRPSYPSWPPRPHAPVVFTGDGADTCRDLIRETLGTGATVTDPAAPLLAGAIARIAAGVVAAGERPGPDAIRPLYVRRPDAELARDARTRR